MARKAGETATDVFRAYDVRGIYGKDLNEEIAENIGKAFGTSLGDGSKVGVARDVRLSSDSLHAALIKGLLYTGCTVVDFGLSPTPLLYFGTWWNKLAGGVMITASHLPPEWNGFKLSDKTGLTLSEGTGLERIREIFSSGKFIKGVKGGITHVDPSQDYVNYVSSKVNIKKGLKIVFDFANSVTSLVVPSILTKFKEEGIFINKELDGTFPNRASEPSEESLQGLRKKVITENADLGIGYDCDGDRVAFVDEKGRIFASGNITIPLLAKYALMVHPGRKIIQDVTCSSAVSDYIKKLGGEPVVVRVGHSYCAYEVLKQHALLGGQYSGHLAFPDMNCADDAIFGSLKILEAMTVSGKRLSELVDEIPIYFTSKMKEIACADTKKFIVINKITKKAKSMPYKLIDIDGVLLYNDDGRVLVRASNTSPIIRVNAEGKTKEKCDKFQVLGETLVSKEVGDD
ncbi:phosphomannomutase/phosphoglucomutase [Candidatus Parvarchaeota archaeon]|nr:phosphomannomutase/phosphoglucomutase [Candidatus Parvarchaeota archaeon]